MEKIRILIVDDHPVVREGLKLALADQPSVEIVGEAANGQEAVERAKAMKPAIVLMDIRMPVMNGLEAAQALKNDTPEIHVIILTMHEDREYIIQATRVGARGYVLKDSSPDELVKAVETVAKGDVYFSPRVSQMLLNDYVTESGGQGKNAKLTPREREVLVLIAEGLSNKESASNLKVSVRTVETHRERIMSKLGIKSVAGLTKYAIAHGMITLK